jgi:succinate dehydrogenase / fumarate reductase cytochrome b subunit
MRFTGVDLHEAAAQSFPKVQNEVHNPLLLAFYIVGLIAASWHFAYGVWLFSAKWGIVTGDKAQARLLRLCMAFFFLLSVVGLASLYTFRTRFQQSSTGGNVVDARPGIENHGRPVN